MKHQQNRIELVTRPVFNEVGDDYDADELENNWETWNPDPIDASATTNAVSRRLDHRHPVHCVHSPKCRVK